MVKIFMQVVIHMYCLLFQLKNGKIFSGTTSGLIQGIFSGCDSVAVLNHTCRLRFTCSDLARNKKSVQFINTKV
jgi:hypothetical protein